MKSIGKWFEFKHLQGQYPNGIKVFTVLTGLVLAFLIILAARDFNSQGQRVLSLGDRGQDVASAQDKLKDKHLYVGPINGFYGIDTKGAVSEFQSENKLRADGVLDPDTKTKLFAPSSTANTDSLQPKEAVLLSALIESEAANEPYIGKLAVGAVVLNRVSSSSFPNSVSGVIYQPGAFESVHNGQLGRPVSSESRRAAEDALRGQDPTGNALFFWNPAKPVNPWVWQRSQTTRIGRHIFAR